jgi:trans-o-hydroxybenzylidenepyruvate hydratase-aldolase
MLTKDDIRGISVMMPTPCIEGGDHWSVTNSVDLEETARVIPEYNAAGIGVLSLNGTTGECAALLWEEKLAFVDTVIQANQKKSPIFAGCTALGTKETIRQMRAMRDLGAEGAFVGLPLWQTPTLENSVQWFADLSEALPDMAIMVYANAMFFKSTFPTPFWEGVAKKSPTVITNKIGSNPMIELLEANVRVSGHQIAHLPIDFAAPSARKLIGDKLHGAWSTSAGRAPEPSVALWDAVEAEDWDRIAEIQADFRTIPSHAVDFTQFAQYNVQCEKYSANAAGFINSGPVRAPYRDFPDDWKEQATKSGLALKEVRKKYMKSKV